MRIFTQTNFLHGFASDKQSAHLSVAETETFSYHPVYILLRPLLFPQRAKTFESLAFNQAAD